MGALEALEALLKSFIYFGIKIPRIEKADLYIFSIVLEIGDALVRIYL